MSPFETVESAMQNEREWVDAAQVEWLDWMLSIFAGPPLEDARVYDWDFVTENYFFDVVERFPTQAFAKITALLPCNKAELRPYLISGLLATEMPEARIWLQPFVDDIENLPLRELEALIDSRGVYEVREWRDILLRILDAIPPVEDDFHNELRAWVEDYLKICENELNEN